MPTIQIKDEAEVQALVKAAEDSKASVLAFKVTDEPSHANGADILRHLNALRDRIEADRTGVTGPLHGVIATVNSWFKPATIAIDEGVAHVKGEIARYVRDVNASRAAQAIAGKPVELAPPQAVGVRVQQTETWEVVDESKVPREFCSPDATKIRKYLKDGGVRAIPGVRFSVKDVVVSARTVRS